MKKHNAMIVIYALVLGLGASAPACVTAEAHNPSTTARLEAEPAIAVAAPARIEGASEVVELGAERDGVVSAVLVDEGQVVRAGDRLIELSCDDRRAELSAAEATLAASRAHRTRLIRGGRDEERRRAEKATAAASAVHDLALSQHKRLVALAESGIISTRDLDEANRNLRVAQSSLAQAREEERLVKSELLPEELNRANAEVAIATHHVESAGARLAQCVIVAPQAGTILRTHVKAGEQVSTAMPLPLISMADLSTMRVRAEVDERDVGLVHPGQPVSVSAASFGGRTITGSVTSVNLLMGRRTVQSGDPAEKSDRDVQEILIDLDPVDAPLIVGLRVTAIFHAAERDS